MASKVELELTASTSKALSSIQRFSDSSSKALKTVESSFSAIKTVAAAAVGFIAARQIVGGIGSVVEAAIKQENAVNKVAIAMKTAGDYSHAALADMQAFAASLEDTTGIGDETTLELIALAKAYGANNEQAKLAAQAAIEYAAATGRDAKQAIAQVSKTLGGYAGELGEVNPRIRALTKEQLQAGEAARVLLQQFGGSAAGMLQTFSGALTNLQGRFAGFQESLGEIIIKNPAVVGAINLLARGIQKLETEFRARQKQISAFVTDSMIGLLKVLSAGEKAFNALKVSVGNIGSIDVKGIFGNIAVAIGFLADEVLLLTRGFVELKLLMQAPIDTILADTLDDLREKRPDLSPFIDQLEYIDRRREELAAAFDPIENGAASVGQAADDSKSAIDDLIKSLESMPATKQIDITERFTEDPQRSGSAIDAATVSSARSEGIFDFGPAVNSLVTARKALTAAGLDFAMNFTKNLTEGAEGARKAVVGALTAGVTAAFGPIAGQVAGPIFDLLSQGPEATRKAITEFAEGIPDVIDAMVDAIPVFVEVLADKADEIIIALVEAAPRISVALARALARPSLYVEFARSIGRAALEGIRYQLGKAGAGLEKAGEFMASIPKRVQFNLSQAITDAFKRLPDLIGTELPVAIGGAFNALQDAIRTKLNLEPVREQLVGSLVETVKIAGGQLSELIRGIGSGIADSAQSVLDNFAEIPNKLDTVPNKLTEAVTSAVNAIKEKLDLKTIKDQIRESFETGAKEFGNNLAMAFKNLVDKLKPGGSSIGVRGKSSQGPIENFFGIDLGGGGVKFARGGTVPPGFPDDTYPALLTSGEEIVDRTTAAMLRSFLERQASAPSSAPVSDQPIQIQLTLDGRVLADYILNLNRRNARLVA